MKKPRAEGKGCDGHSQECRHYQQGPEHGLATSVVMQSLSLVSAFVSLSFLCHLGTKADTYESYGSPVTGISSHCERERLSAHSKMESSS